MKFYLRGLVVLPVFLVLTGFGPLDFQEGKQDYNALTHISLENKVYLSQEEIEGKIKEYEAKNTPLPVVARPVRSMAQRGTHFVSATAYSSTVDQCDSTPFITASGQHVRDGIIAANFLPFGTKVRIPEIYGDKVFEVQDRMNQRYSYRIDIWMPSRGQALQFGLRQVKIEVL